MPTKFKTNRQDLSSVRVKSDCPNHLSIVVVIIVHRIIHMFRVFLSSKKSLWLGHFYYQHMVPSKFYQCPLPECSKTVSKLEDDHGLRTHLASHHSLQVSQIVLCYSHSYAMIPL